MKTLSKIPATFLGVGYFPIGPGTVTSLIVCLLYKFFLYKLSVPAYAAVLVGLFVMGAVVSTRFAKALNRKDPSLIVIDESCGQLIALFGVSSGWGPVLLSFLIFRFFDIIKPFPIRRLEKLPWGWGIMADDVGAGLYSVLILQVILRLL